MNRIIVIGTTGSGKSTLARQLAQKLACICVDGDDLGWDANWVMPSDAVLRKRVDDALQPDTRWVTSGNRAIVRDIIWASLLSAGVYASAFAVGAELTLQQP